MKKNNNKKKQLLIFPFIFTIILIHTFNIAMEKTCKTEQTEKPAMHIVYAHGFGEDGSSGNNLINLIGDKNSSSFFDFPDAPGQLNKAVFYSKPAVHALANHLKKQVKSKKKESIVLIGRSMGAGTTINCLNALNTYDSDYFDGTGITYDDARDIMEAINNGGIVLTAPCIDMRKVSVIASFSKILSGCFCGLAGLLTYYYGSSQIISDEFTPPLYAKIGLMGLSFAAAYYVLSLSFKRLFASLITKSILPLVTTGYFDPTHPTPLQSAEGLRDVLKCPILLHFNAKDGILENPDEDTVQIYDALKNDNTRILISTDSSHNGWLHEQLDTGLKIFGQKLRGDKSKLFNDDQNYQNIFNQWDYAMKPSIDQLRNNIKNNKFTL